MRISDWSSDVCSSDLLVQFPIAAACDSHRPDETQPFAAIVIFIGEEVLGDFHPRPGARAIGNREQRRGDQRGKEEHDLEQPPPVAAHQPQPVDRDGHRSEEHTYELKSLMSLSYAVFGLNKTIRQAL